MDDVRAIASSLPRATEGIVRDRVKFRVGRLVFLAFSADERFMGPWRRLFQDWFLEMPDGLDGGERISAHLPQLLMDAAQCEGCFALLELKQAKRHFNPQICAPLAVLLRTPTVSTPLGRQLATPHDR